MTITQHLTDQATLALIIEGEGLKSKPFVTFTGPGYSFKVQNTPARIKWFIKALEKARRDAIRKPSAPVTVSRQISYANSDRGQHEALGRLSGDLDRSVYHE